MAEQKDDDIAWPYEVLAEACFEDLVAVDDGEAWQQESTLKLLGADSAKVGWN